MAELSAAGHSPAGVDSGDRMATRQILVVVDTAIDEEQPVIELLLGSTAARVLDRLPCDLVIVKAGEPALPR
jgi:hypothetical protein